MGRVGFLQLLSIDQQWPEALILLESAKPVSISGARLRFQSKGKMYDIIPACICAGWLMKLRDGFEDY